MSANEIPASQPKSIWSFASGVQPGDDLPSSSELIMAWARDRETGSPRYIMELGAHQRGAQCGCDCISCGLPLTAVNAAKSTFRKRPHFRHPNGSEKDSCMILSARAAVAAALFKDDILVLPGRRVGAQVTGMSGQIYEGWVDLPDEKIHISTADFRDAISAVLTLDDGRKIVVDLRGSVEASGDEMDAVTAKIVLSVNDPAIAGMSLDDIRSRLTLLLQGACWHRHWNDAVLHEQAMTAAVAAADDALDWEDELEGVAEGDLVSRRETILHREVKAILERTRRLWLPGFEVVVARSRGGRTVDRRENLPCETRTLLGAVLEKKLGRIVPDVLATFDPEGQLLIEVTVTNHVTEDRLTRIREVNLPTLEIDLSRMAGQVTRSQLERIVIDEAAGKRWLHHPGIEAIRQRLIPDVEAMLARPETAGPPTAHSPPVVGGHGWNQASRNAPNSEDWRHHSLAQLYLEKVVSHAQCRVTADAQPTSREAAHAREIALKALIEVAIQLEQKGYNEATNRSLFFMGKNILERILSIKNDVGVGSEVRTGAEAIEHILQDGRESRRWHTLYLMAVKTYKPALTNEQMQRVQEWREDARRSLEAGETTYLRDARYDMLLSMLFPEMCLALDKAFGRAATQSSGPPLSAPSSFQDFYLSAYCENLMLRGQALEEWKRRNPEAAEDWFGKKQ